MKPLFIDPTLPRSTRYATTLQYIQALLTDETDWVAGLANTVAALREGLGFFWIGFYRVHGQELVLGPFQGAVACVHIAYGKGVCGKAWSQKQTQVVPDVEAFPGHIACNAASRSEIVVPLVIDQQVVLVLDIDSTKPNDFDAIDQVNIEKLCTWLQTWLANIPKTVHYFTK